MKLIKYLLFFFNLLFALSGLLLVIVGCVIQGAYKSYLDFIGNGFLNTPVFIIVVGCIIFFVAFFGCCGAIKENHCMTVTFAVLLGVIFLMEVGAGIAAYKLKTQVHHLVEKNMEKGMKNYNQTGHEGVTKTWDVIQREIGCCGTQEFRDWSNTTFSERSNVPDSCCLSDIAGCGQNVLTQNDENAAKKIHTMGCFKGFSEKIKSNISAIGGVGIGVGVVQLAGMIFAACLSHSLKKEYETV